MYLNYEWSKQQHYVMLGGLQHI